VRQASAWKFNDGRLRFSSKFTQDIKRTDHSDESPIVSDDEETMDFECHHFADDANHGGLLPKN
jgi:hypothetical protein